MAYDPQVVDAKIVSENKKEGLVEVLVVLNDRNQCRLVFETDLETGLNKATNLNRLMKEPCPICRRDYLCHCLNKYLPTIAGQAEKLLK